MTSIVELNARLDDVRAQMRGLIDIAKGEARHLTDEETASLNAMKAEADSITSSIATEIERQKNINNLTPKKMEKKRFSLLQAVRSIVDGTPMSEENAATIAAGKQQMRAAGLNSAGSIVIPTAETRATVSVTGTDGATVPVDVAAIYDELRAESVLEKAGASYYTGLVGDLKVPMMTAASVAWAEENGAAADAAADIKSVTLSPKRLTAYMDISKQLLVQDAGSNAEAALTANLIRAINDKFEATILADGAATATQPAGLFNGRTATTTSNWAGVVGLEAAVKRANGRVRAIIASPEAEAAFLAMENNKKTQLVIDGGTLNGVPCYSTANVAANSYLVGDFAYLCVGMWGGIDITVDPYTQAGNGAIRLVVNVYMDAAMPEGADAVIAAGKTSD